MLVNPQSMPPELRGLKRRRISLQREPSLLRPVLLDSLAARLFQVSGEDESRCRLFHPLPPETMPRLPSTFVETADFSHELE